MIPRTAVLLAGIVAESVSVLIDLVRPVRPMKPKDMHPLDLRWTQRYDKLDSRLAAVEARVDRHDEKLVFVPSREQLIAALEEVFGRTIDALDERFAEQMRSMEDLRIMAAQTDELLERVLISVDSLQPEMAGRPRATGTPRAS